MNSPAHQLKNYLEMLKQSGVDFLPKAGSPLSSSNVLIGNPKSGFPIKAFGNDNDGIVSEKFVKLKQTVHNCTKCSELAAKRKNVVFGSGNPNAKLVFVGEAPGQDEDIQGLPFVGKAGQLLTKIIESIGQSRESVFICNVLKCRPPGNRNPIPQEISNCEPYLIDQINLIQPKIICALGTFAAQTLLKTEDKISSLRGRFYDYHGSKLLCTFHPAYLLRNPEEKRKVWEDMKMIRAELERV